METNHSIEIGTPVYVDLPGGIFHGIVREHKHKMMTNEPTYHVRGRDVITECSLKFILDADDVPIKTRLKQAGAKIARPHPTNKLKKVITHDGEKIHESLYCHVSVAVEWLSARGF